MYEEMGQGNFFVLQTKFLSEALPLKNACDSLFLGDAKFVVSHKTVAYTVFKRPMM